METMLLMMSKTLNQPIRSASLFYIHYFETGQIFQTEMYTLVLTLHSGCFFKGELTILVVDIIPCKKVCVVPKALLKTESEGLKLKV